MARWSDLKSLFRVEEASKLKQSKLDFVSVHPKPIECQNVKLVYVFFCNETATALQTHTGIDSMVTVGTVSLSKCLFSFRRL